MIQHSCSVRVQWPRLADFRMLTEKSALIAVLTGAIAPILPPYTISLGPLYHKILSPPLLKYKLGLAKMKQASKKTQKLLICEMSSNTANKMRGAQTLWNINHFIGGYNLFRTTGTYLLNKGKKTPFRKIVILEKLLLCEMSSSTVKWEEVSRLFDWNIYHFIGGHNLFQTKRTYLLNKAEKRHFAK